MLDKIENKLIDKLNTINLMTISNLFDCKVDEVGPILTNYFNKRKSFNGDIDLIGINNIKSLGTIRRIEGDLTVMYSSLESLGDLKIVRGQVTIINTLIKSTNKLMYCAGLTIEGSSFTEIKSLTEVNGNVKISATNIETLNTLSLIGGSLGLYRNKVLASLGGITKVNGDLVIDRCNKLLTLGVLKHISGCFDVRTAKLTSFGSLNELDGFVIALKSTVNNLYESGLEIIDFKPLTTMFSSFPKCMHLKVPKIDKLENFGMIIIDDEPEELFL